MALSSSVPSIATAPTAKSGMAGSLLPKQQHAILKKIGFTGPVNTNSMNQFMQSTPGAASLVLKLTKAAKGIKNLNAGGVVSSGYETGGLVTYTFTYPNGYNTIQTTGATIDEAKTKAASQYRSSEQHRAKGGEPINFINSLTVTEKPANAQAYILADLPVPVGTPVTSGSRRTAGALKSKGYTVEGGVIATVPQEQTQTAVTPSADPDPKNEISAAVSANTAATNTTTDSSAAASTTTGNENTMAEETREDSAEVKKLKNLNDRLTIAKQNLVEQQTLLADEKAQRAAAAAAGTPDNADGEAAAQKKVTAAQIKVNTLVGELSTLATGKQSETSLLAVADPASLVEKSTIAKLDPATAGTTIAEGTGQLSGETPKTTVTTVDTQAMVDAPAAITAKTAAVTETKAGVDAALKNVSAVQGTVSDEAQVTAEQGELSEGATAAAVKVDPTKVVEVIAGERTVTSDEMAVAQGLDEKAVKANIAEANVPDNIKAAKTSVSPEEIPKPAQILESDMASAKAITDAGLTADATATAAKLAKFTVDAQTLVEFKEGKIEAEDTV